MCSLTVSEETQASERQPIHVTLTLMLWKMKLCPGISKIFDFSGDCRRKQNYLKKLARVEVGWSWVLPIIKTFFDHKYFWILMNIFQLPVLPSLKNILWEYKPRLHVKVRLLLTLTKRNMSVYVLLVQKLYSYIFLNYIFE